MQRRVVPRGAAEHAEITPCIDRTAAIPRFPWYLRGRPGNPGLLGNAAGWTPGPIGYFFPADSVTVTFLGSDERPDSALPHLSTCLGLQPGRCHGGIRRVFRLRIDRPAHCWQPLRPYRAPAGATTTSLSTAAPTAGRPPLRPRTRPRPPTPIAQRSAPRWRLLPMTGSSSTSTVSRPSTPHCSRKSGIS